MEKLVERLLSSPKDFTWNELVRVLSNLGFEELSGGKTSGSRRKFADRSNNILSLHKPHPGNILKTYQVKQVVNFLINRGHL
jgi:hypothetical protein